MSKSIDIKNRIMTLEEKKRGGLLKAAASEISDIELIITKLLMEVKESDTPVGESLLGLRDHLIEVYQRVCLALLRKHLSYED
jgi:hypothetical protein